MEGAGKGAEVRTHVRELLEVVGLQRVAATHVAVVDVGAGETGDRRLHQAEQSRAEQSRAVPVPVPGIAQMSIPVHTTRLAGVGVIVT